MDALCLLGLGKKLLSLVSLGGLGLRLASSHAPAAFYSSAYQTSSLVCSILGRSPAPSPVLGDVLLALSSAGNHPDWSSPDALDVPITQFHLSRVIDQAHYDSLLQVSSDLRSKAIILSTSIQHAGDWLHVVPSTQLGLHLKDWEFRLCLRYWLGIQLVGENSLCPICGCQSDTMGDHYVSCRGNADLISRHNCLRDVLFAAAHTATLSPRKELPALIPGSSSRPADVYLPCWHRGKPAAFDISVISPVQALTIDSAATIQGYVLTVRERQKRRIHVEGCLSAGIDFVPIAVETLGGLSSISSHTISELGKLQANRLGLSPSHCASHLFQRFSLTLWRGNAACWISRNPVISPSIDGIA